MFVMVCSLSEGGKSTGDDSQRFPFSIVCWACQICLGMFERVWKGRARKRQRERERTKKNKRYSIK